MSLLSADQPERLTPKPFSFEGESKTYFFICLRTFLLAIITLGIYDAWGTVERRRYMAGNTKVDGHGFDYHARPMTILIGRFIALAVIIGFQVAASFYLPALFVFMAFLFFAAPWIINRALIFQLRNTSYRNIRFDFNPGYWHLFTVLYLLPLAVAFTAGIAYPWSKARYQEYIGNRASYGTSSFSLQVALGPLFKAFFVLIGLGIVFIILQTIVVMQYGPGFSGGPVSGAQMQDFQLIQFGLTVPFYLILGIAFLRFQVVLRNETFNGLSLQGGHRFTSNLPFWPYAWLLISRAFLATITLGLLIPWMVVQIHRFMMAHTTLLAKGDLDSFIDHEKSAGGAAGAEYGAMEGIADGAFGAI